VTFGDATNHAAPALAAAFTTQYVSVCFTTAILQVSFEVSDAAKRDFPAGTFDVVISRDTLLHIGDKPAIFKRCALLAL